MELTDAQLVARTLEGSREAFTALVRRHQNYAYGTAIGLLSNFELAQDVVQEAFLAAWQGLGSLRDPERFGLWLRGIVRNSCHSALRELANVRQLAAQLRRSEPATAPPPDGIFFEREERTLVHVALARLRESHREVLSLYYLDDLSYRDIAVFLEVTETAVKGRLQYARAKMREEIDMVEESFRQARLPEDFAEQVQSLLEIVHTRHQEAARISERLAAFGEQAVDPLVECLEDERLAVRHAAARALCDIGDPRAVQPVLRVLFAHLWWTRWPADVLPLGHLLHLEGVREALLDTVRSNEDGQWMAFAVLGFARGDGEVVDVVAATADDPAASWHRRLRAVQALEQLQPGTIEGRLADFMCSDDYPLVLMASRFACHRDLRPPLNACVSAFGTIASGVATSGLRPDLRQFVHLILRHGDEGAEAIHRLAAQAPVEVRAAVLVARAEGGHVPSSATLREQLAGGRADDLDGVNPDGTLRPWGMADLLFSLARNRPQEAGPLVEGFWRRGHPRQRTAALRIIAHQRGVDAIPELRRALSSGRPCKGKIVREAFRQMAKLGDAALPTVAQMLESDDWSQRKTAVALLRRWGKLTAQQRQRAGADPHRAVREAAATLPKHRESA